MRNILIFSAIAIAIALFWYLMIKPYDYKVSFSIKASPGTINQTIKLWNESLNNSSIVNQKSIKSLEQQIIEGEHK